MRSCTAAAALLAALSLCTAPARADSTLNTLGFEYSLIKTDGINFSCDKTQPNTNWYAPAHRVETAIGFANALGDPSRPANWATVRAQLAGMAASGATELAIPIWIMNLHDCQASSCRNSDGLQDGTFGQQIDDNAHENPWDATDPYRTAHSYNLARILMELPALGFKRVILRFNPYYPEWNNSWNEDEYQHIWQFISRTYFLADWALQGTGVSFLLDLGGEFGGNPHGVITEYNRRIWIDYTNNFPLSRTLGFSFADVPDPAAGVLAMMAQVGQGYPSIWAFDLYPTGAKTMGAYFDRIQATLHGFSGQPVIILETWHDEVENVGGHANRTFDDLKAALQGHPGLHVDGLFAWPLSRARAEGLGLPAPECNFTNALLDGQTGTNQFPTYQALLGRRRVDLTSSDTGRLLVASLDCGSTTAGSCSVKQTWAAPPAGQQLVLSVIADQNPEQLEHCDTAAGSVTAPWISPGHTYRFFARWRSSCALGPEAPAATAVLTVGR